MRLECVFLSLTDYVDELQNTLNVVLGTNCRKCTIDYWGSRNLLVFFSNSLHPWQLIPGLKWMGEASHIGNVDRWMQSRHDLFYFTSTFLRSLSFICTFRWG